MDTSTTRGWPIEEKLRFHSKDAENGCRVWTAAIVGDGYGQIWFKGKSALAHRVALELKLGRPIKPKHDAAHLCHNSRCINPDHLEEATRQKNIRDRVLSGRGAFGERVGGAKLTADKVMAIRRDPRPERQLAKLYGVSANVIGEIKRGRIWKHLPP